MHYMRDWPLLGPAGFGGPIVMLLFGLIIIGILIYLIVAVSRNNSGKLFSGTSNRDSSEKALEILEERFAKGELTKEEFESMRKTLRS